MTMAPTGINAIRARCLIEVTWPDGRVDQLANKQVRCACGCALCVDEMTRQPLLDPDTIPDDIQVVGMSAIGNYAVAITWSDGHDTGILSWANLRALADAAGETDEQA